MNFFVPRRLQAIGKGKTGKRKERSFTFAYIVYLWEEEGAPSQKRSRDAIKRDGPGDRSIIILPEGTP